MAFGHIGEPSFPRVKPVRSQQFPEFGIEDSQQVSFITFMHPLFTSFMHLSFVLSPFRFHSHGGLQEQFGELFIAKLRQRHISRCASVGGVLDKFQGKPFRHNCITGTSGGLHGLFHDQFGVIAELWIGSLSERHGEKFVKSGPVTHIPPLKQHPWYGFDQQSEISWLSRRNNKPVIGRPGNVYSVPVILFDQQHPF